MIRTCLYGLSLPWARFEAWGWSVFGTIGWLTVSTSGVGEISKLELFHLELLSALTFLLEDVQWLEEPWGPALANWPLLSAAKYFVLVWNTPSLTSLCRSPASCLTCTLYTFLPVDSDSTLSRTFYPPEEMGTL